MIVLRKERDQARTMTVPSFENFAAISSMGSINQILQLLQEYMEMPDVVHYGNGYYQHTIYGIGPYIADYPEQVLLACVMQGWCQGEP